MCVSNLSALSFCTNDTGKLKKVCFPLRFFFLHPCRSLLTARNAHNLFRPYLKPVSSTPRHYREFDGVVPADKPLLSEGNAVHPEVDQEPLSAGSLNGSEVFGGMDEGYIEGE